MKTIIAAIILIITTNTNLMAQDVTVRRNIEQAALDPKTAERAAKADALLTSKRKLINSDTIGKTSPNKNNKTTCGVRKNGQPKQD